MQKLVITAIVGILIGATAFSTSPSTGSGQSPTTAQAPTPPETKPNNRRFKITVTVAAMTDLKVQKDQMLQAGDIIADLTSGHAIIW